MRKKLTTGNRVPPNCRFEVDDAELDWTYKEVCLPEA